MSVSEMFFGKKVRRSIRFNHDHVKQGHATAGLPWRIIDLATDEQTFAKSLTSQVPCTTELVTVDNEVKGNIVVEGYFYHDEDQHVTITNQAPDEA